MKPEHKEYILQNVDKLSVKRISQDLNLKEKKIWEFLEYQKGKKEQPEFPSQKTETPSKKKPVVLSIALIIILGFTVYGNSLNNDFFWDDKVLIEDNEYIKKWSYIPQTFTQDIGAGGGKEWNFYRPLQMVTYMVDYSLWKLNAKGYHLTNILLHIFAALAIYWFVNIISRENGISLLTGIFFVVHPIHTEAVTYIAGRADSLALLFMLLCLSFYIKSPPSKRIGEYLLMVLSYVLALLSKESSLILPVLLLLYHYSFDKKVRVKEFFSLISIALIYILLRVIVLKALLTHMVYSTTLFQRLPGFFVAVTNYIKILFIPFNLHMEYGNELFPWGNFKVILGAMILVALFVYAFRRKKIDKLVFFSIVWFFIALLPVSNLYPINAYMAEHWLYLPSVGFFLVIAKATHSLYKVRNFKIVTTIFMASLLIFYSYLTIRQNIYWGEPIKFYERTLKYAPNSSRAYSNLGREYNASNRREDAIAAYKKAIEIEPDYAEAYYNLGNVYKAINKNKEAIAAYKKAIKIKADHATYNNLGNVYQSINKSEDAIAAYKKAIEIEPDYADTYYSLGNTYKAINKNEDAIVAYKKVIKIKSGYVQAYNNLGIVYRAVHKNNKAIASYKKAIQIKPNFADAYYNLGNVYNDMEKKEEAIASYKRAIEINPNYAVTYSNLAVVYFQKKQYKLAIEYFEKAEKLGFTNPALSEALKPYR